MSKSVEVSERGASVVQGLVAAPILQTLAAHFSEVGYELYLVGGSVRDALLHRPTHDLDLATDAHPPAIKRLAGAGTAGCPAMTWGRNLAR